MGPGRMAEEYTHSHGSKVSEVMSTEVQSVSEDASLEDIVRLMEKHHIKRVPVMHGAKMVGIVTRSNLMHAMVGLARKARAGEGRRRRHPRATAENHGGADLGAHRHGRRAGA